jgi:Ca-activated chloride channel family protein
VALLGKKIALLLLLFLGAGSLVVQAQEAKPAGRKTRILFLLDASGSMLAKWEGTDRMAVAKDLLTKLVDSLSTYPDLELALRVYGHLPPATKADCENTRLEVPFAARNLDQIKQKIGQIVPRGNTPITYSMLQAAHDFPADKKTRNVLILITDGQESCGGDPCQTSQALQKKGVFLRPFIVGIGTNREEDQQLSCIGQYFNASDISTFRNVLATIVAQTLAKTTVSVALTDAGGRPVETNVNLTFINALTGEPEYNYVHYLDAQQKPDLLDVDALLPYELHVNTLPPVTVRNLEIVPGRHNQITVRAPQGVLDLKQDGPDAYRGLQAVVRESGSNQTIYVQTFGRSQKYLEGLYDLEILTLPRIYLRQVAVKQGQITPIRIPPPGLLSIPSELQGFGTLYSVDEQGRQRWIYQLPEHNSKLSLPLQPGQYRLVYRIKAAQGSRFTDVQNFEIRSGATTTLKLFNR